MANTIRKYTGDGVRTIYPIDFELGYIRREFVYVYTTNKDEQLSYTWVDNSQIELTSPVPSGTELSIRRIVPKNYIVNNYTDGSILKEKNLDNSHLQHVMIAQEFEDGFLTLEEAYTIQTNLLVNGDLTVDGDVDLLGNKLVNLATPTTASDAVNKGYVDSFLDGLSNLQAVIPVSERHISDGVKDTYAVRSSDGWALKENSYMVFLDGVKQAPIADYTYYNSTLTFVEIPPEHTIIDIIFFEPNVVGQVVNVSVEGQGVTPVDKERVFGDGVTTEYAIPAPTYKTAGEESYMVYLDGVKQRAFEDYTVQGALLTFIEAPANGVRIDITFYEPNVFASDDWGTVANAATEPDYDFGTI